MKQNKGGVYLGLWDVKGSGAQMLPKFAGLPKELLEFAELPNE